MIKIIVDRIPVDLSKIERFQSQPQINIHTSLKRERSQLSIGDTDYD